MIESDGEKVSYFCMLQFAGKRTFKCKLRYLETPKQAHFRMKMFLKQEALNPNNKYYLSKP